MVPADGITATVVAGGFDPGSMVTFTKDGTAMDPVAADDEGVARLDDYDERGRFCDGVRYRVVSIGTLKSLPSRLSKGLLNCRVWPLIQCQTVAATPFISLIS